MELLRSQKNWDALGKDDPLWVILTHPDKKGGKWDPSDFFATGESEIADVLRNLVQLGPPVQPGKALDFGCGVGRLTQALALHFNEVHGVDISPSMIEQARQFNRKGDKCTFHTNSQNNLQLFPDNSFDFIYSNFVLQHIEPQYSLQYIAEFVRVLKPGGRCVFQITTATWLRRFFPEFLMEQYRRMKYRDKPCIGMFGIPEGQIVSTIHAAGGEVLQIRREQFDEFALRWRWVSLHLVLSKSGASQ